jgi:hypothetical protein
MEEGSLNLWLFFREAEGQSVYSGWSQWHLNAKGRRKGSPGRGIQGTASFERSPEECSDFNLTLNHEAKALKVSPLFDSRERAGFPPSPAFSSPSCAAP